MTSVRLDRISKVFGTTQALRNVTLDIGAGELFFLLGPSGCGKSTLLRLVAGLHEPSGGRIWFNDRDVTALGTDKRNAVMCFQSYALWPHMTVLDNVRFGLKVRGLPRREQDRRLAEVLRLVQMAPYAGRKPNELSGGQQQRVALARALAVNPDCLLLDDPLSNLDAKLCHEMRGEIRRICKTAGVTTIYVTHDQNEALTMADRIAVMRDGKLVQVGRPGDLYHRPLNSFVGAEVELRRRLHRPDEPAERPGARADRLDRDGANQGRHDHRRRRQRATAREGRRQHPPGADPRGAHAGRRRRGRRRQRRGLGARPANHLVGRPIETTFLGESSEHVLSVNDERLKVISTPPMLDVPDQVSIEFRPEDVVVLPE